MSRGAAFPAGVGGRPRRKPGWLASRRERLAAVAPSRGAHVTAVCFGRGSCRGQCKDVTPERSEGGRPGMSAGSGEGGGVAAAQPGQSRPVTAILPWTP